MKLTVTVDVIVTEPSWRGHRLPYQRLTKRLAIDTIMRDKRPEGTYSMAVMFTNDAEMQRLNEQFRHVAKPTNVLAFPNGEGSFLGDIALGYQTIAAEAVAQGKAFDHHVQHLLVHGMLHLLGYDHQTDAEAALMEAAEIEILAARGIANPYESPCHAS